MNNRITTPQGDRITLTEIECYRPFEQTIGGHDSGFDPYLVYRIRIERIHSKDDWILTFKTEGERDAFLVRLDNFFTEIA